MNKITREQVFELHKLYGRLDKLEHDLVHISTRYDANYKQLISITAHFGHMINMDIECSYIIDYLKFNIQACKNGINALESKFITEESSDVDTAIEVMQARVDSKLSGDISHYVQVSLS